MRTRIPVLMWVLVMGAVVEMGAGMWVSVMGAEVEPGAGLVGWGPHFQFWDTPILCDWRLPQRKKKILQIQYC